jgi:hypothetical protein
VGAAENAAEELNREKAIIKQRGYEVVGWQGDLIKCRQSDTGNETMKHLNQIERQLTAIERMALGLFDVC